MKSIDTLLALPVLQTLGWALIHSLWQGGLVALSMASATFLLRRSGANARYLVGCFLLVLMLALPILTIWRVSLPLPTSFSAVPIEEGIQAQTTVGPQALTSESEVQSGLQETNSQSASASLLALAGLCFPWLALFWLMGVLVMSARLAGGWFYVRRLKVRKTRPVNPRWQRLLEGVASRMGVNAAVRLLESTCAKAPMVIGALRPVILVPASALTGLPVTQLEAVLAHELAHIRRYDYLVNLLQTMVETLLFYHPAVWWISRQIRSERENSCDDWAVTVCGNASTYAVALTDMEEARRNSPSLSVAASGGRLVDRIRRLLSVSPPRRSNGGWPGVVLCVGLLVVVSLALQVSILESFPRVTGEGQMGAEHLSDWKWERRAALFRSEVQYEGDLLPEDSFPPFATLHDCSYIQTPGAGVLNIQDIVAETHESGRSTCTYYLRNDPLSSTDDAVMEFRARVNSTDPEGSRSVQAGFLDGSKFIQLGLSTTEVMLQSTQGKGIPIVRIPLDGTVFHTYRLEKHADVAVDVFVDGELKVRLPYDSMPDYSGPDTPRQRFGAASGWGISDSDWDYVHYIVAATYATESGLQATQEAWKPPVVWSKSSEDIRVYKDGSGITNPVPTVQTTPSYTDEALEAKVQGIVWIQAIVRKQGTVDSFKVLRGLGYGLEEQAIQEIATNWRFRPGLLNGNPVDVLATIEVQFELE